MTLLAGPTLVKMVGQVRHSLVELVGPGGRSATGVVLPGGTTVLTAAAAVAGSRTVEVLTESGRRITGEVVGSDSRSGVAVVKLSIALSPATFADESVSPGQMTVSACLCLAGRVDSAKPMPAPSVAVGRVTAVGGDERGSSSTGLVETIEADAPTLAGSWGGVLLDDRGAVIGILDGETADSTGREGLFVPSPLAVGVADEIAQGRPVVHGWLGVAGTDPSDGSCGVVVQRVMAYSPAQLLGITAGDMIASVDGHPVCSLPELQARLYVTAPGQSIELVIVTPSGPATKTATLAGAIATASAG